MRIDNEILLDYNDVVICPNRSTIESRAEVVLSREYLFNDQVSFRGIPIMSANKSTTGTIETAEALSSLGLFTCLHKDYEIEDLFTFFFTEPRPLTAYSMGIGDADMHKWETLKGRLPKGNIQFVCIDVANGYTERFVKFVREFKEANSDIVVIAGNVVTADMTEELILNGVDIVKVGIGCSSLNSISDETGVGYPQLSAVIECADAAHGLGGRIIADGGCSTSGDVAKALAAGADFVMLGNMFAGHEESGGETIVSDGQMYKGEGILFKGSIVDTVSSILDSLRSTCGYVGATTLQQLNQRTTFKRINKK